MRETEEKKQRNNGKVQQRINKISHSTFAKSIEKETTKKQNDKRIRLKHETKGNKTVLSKSNKLIIQMVFEYGYWICLFKRNAGSFLFIHFIASSNSSFYLSITQTFIKR